MEINGYNLSRKWFDFCFENPDKISTNHTALYMFIIEQWNRFGQKEKFGLPSLYSMEVLGIKSKTTYYKTFNDLIEFGFIKIIEKSKNQNTANIIAISKIKSADSSAPVSALDLANIQQVDSTCVSGGNIDKQINHLTNKQINNLYNSKDKEIIVAPKVATLENIIKERFDIEFIGDIYKKYSMSKEEFREECNSFLYYWKEKGINGKKERWEKEKIFDPKLRFRNWMKNNEKWNKKIIVNQEDEERKRKLEELRIRKENLFNNF